MIVMFHWKTSVNLKKMAQQGKQIRNIWMVSREYGDLAGAGGVKDVVYQLSKALARWTGRSLNVVLPGYGCIDYDEAGFVPLRDPLCPTKDLKLAINLDLPDNSVKETVQFYYKRDNRVHIYLIDAKRYREKTDIYTYTEVDEQRTSWQKKSQGHHDYFAMNILHQKATLELIIALSVRPDIIHCHDGHTALLSALIRENAGYSSYFRGTACLVTLHNAGYGYHQEVGDLPYAVSTTGLPARVIDTNLLELQFDPLLVAGQYATINTVSENYARELQESESDKLTGWLGHELKSRGVIISGITNGIDPEYYHPRAVAGDRKELLFDPENRDDSLRGKILCKKTLLTELSSGSESLSLEQYGTLTSDVKKTLFTFVGRLSEQKGVDLLLEAIPVLLARHENAQVLILGSGSKELESALVRFAGNIDSHGRVCYLKGFSTLLAKKIYAAGDFFIVPSRYEPCGLTDFIAQLHGNIPIVHRVGGLVKIVDGQTGISYKGEGPGELLAALERGLSLGKDARREIQYKAVAKITKKYTWTHVMRSYVELYKRCSVEQLPC